MFRISRLFYNPSIQRIFKSTFIYAGGDFLNKAIPFMLIPVLTRFLSTEDYGMLATFMAIFGIVQIIISMGTTEAIVRGYFDRGKDNFYFPEYVFNGLLINFFVFFIIIFLWVMSRNLLIKLIPIPFGFQLLTLLVSLFAGVSTIPSKLWVYMKKPLPFTVFNTLRTLWEVVLSIWLVVFLGFGWDGRVLGIFVGKGLFFIIGIGVLLHSGFLRISFNTDHIKSIVRYGAPIVLHSLGFVVIAAIDRFFLYTFINLSTTGIYSVSYSVCTVIMLITGALNLALSPRIYERLDNATDAFKQKLVKYTYCYFLLIFMGVAAFIFLAPGFLNIYLGEAFLDAKKFIFWLALGFGFHSLYITVVSYIFYSKKTHMLSKIAVITVILSVILNYILIKWNGAIGVAQATCLVFFSRFLMAWYASHKVYPLPWLSFMNRIHKA